jgi:glycosyltransferase involved in cell wall biosynthesis
MKKLLYIGNQLSSHGFNLSSIETLTPLLENEKYIVFTASSKRNIYFRFLDMVFRTLKHHSKVDYVLIDTYSTLNFWYALLISQLCRLLKLKYIPILHGGKLPEKINYHPFLTGLIFKHAYVNVVPSRFLFQKFQNKSWTNCVYLPNQIEIKNYSFQERKELNPKILWVRSLSKIYNPTMAIDVIEKVISHYPKIELCMVGPENGFTVEDLKKYAKNKKINVIFTGKLSKAEWIELSKDFDIFINTTHFDNTPVSLIEALALGLPVVSTNVGGIPYLVKDRETAILVNDSDAQAMADAITELIKNPELAQKLAANGRKLAEQFDWHIVKNQWKEILK